MVVVSRGKSMLEELVDAKEGDIAIGRAEV
jgi:hypothetical protein